MESPPDIVLLAPEWATRLAIRAQLIEDGFDVVATDTWSMLRSVLRPGMKPRAVLVDLKALPDPVRVLDDLPLLMKPDRVLVITASGTVSHDDVAQRGFHVVSRPLILADVVGTAEELVRSHVRSPR
jgi:hypothetical protein